MDEDFEDWALHELQERVELIQSFDRLCDDIVSAYADICRNYRIAEEQILVPKTIKVLGVSAVNIWSKRLSLATPILTQERRLFTNVCGRSLLRLTSLCLWVIGQRGRFTGYEL